MRKRSTIWQTALAAVCIAVIPSVSMAAVTTIDDGALAGWTATGDVLAVSAPASGGNPGGYCRVDDRASGDMIWVIAPPEYLGNWHSKATLSADLIQFSASGTSLGPVQFEISGPGGCYTRTFPTAPLLGVWRTYGTPLDESLWTRQSGAWSTLLDNVTQLRILCEYINGDEVNGLDNVALLDGGAACRIGEAKVLPDGTCVTLTGIVTRVLSDSVYIQETDRSSGIRLKNNLAVDENSLITVTGLLGTLNRERVLENPTVLSVQPATAPVPLKCITRDLGGRGAAAADPALGTAPGLKNTGLLVAARGRVTVLPPAGEFELDDGGEHPVLAQLDNALALPLPGSYISCTGISGARTDGVDAPLLLSVRDVQDCWLPLGVNLLRNPGAEEGPSGSGAPVRPMLAWTPTSDFTAANYGSTVPAEQSTAIGGGRSFFYGGNNSAYSEATQVVDVSQFAALADAGGLQAKLSGYLAGYDTQGDSATVTAAFQDATGAVLGSIQIGPQTGSMQKFIFHQQNGAVPTFTRSVQVKMMSRRAAGSNNDGYFDNISLVLTAP